MVGSIKDYTTHLKLIIPRFDVATWHDFMESNFRAIDALFYNLYGINNFSGEWSKVTQYTKDQVIFIGEDIDLDGNHTIYEGRLVKVLQDHTTDNSDYFNIYQSLHPEYYQLFFDANNAEVFAENAFNYMNTTEEYKNFTESLKNLYEDYLNQTNIAKNDAQSAANGANLSKNEAETAANTAIQTVNTATDLLNEVEEFTQEALSTINTTKDTTIETVNHTKDEAISTIQETVENAQKTVDEKITTAEEELDDTIRTAIIEAKDEVKAEADKAIQNAEEIATNYAKEGVTTYTNDVIIPRLDESIQDAQSFAEQAQTSATNSQNSATLASNYEESARNSASSASVSADKAENSENNCREILERVGTVIKIIGRVDTVEDLPTSGNINGDAYLVGEEGLESYPEYYWYNDHWEFLGTTSTKISWEVINAALPDQTGNEGKSFITNGTEADWQYNINYRGTYNSTTQYYPGDVVQYYYDNVYRKYLCITSVKNNSPNNETSTNWSPFDAPSQIRVNQYWGDYPILPFMWNGAVGSTITGVILVPGTTSTNNNFPTINTSTGLLKAPNGIEGYYTSEQVDDLISTAGANVDNKSITKNTDNQIQAVGVIEKNTGAVKYDWIGTLAEYNSQNVETLHPDWVCFITDDVSGGTSVYTKAETDDKLLLKQDIGTAVNYDNITNCITEIPQDIKLELNNGTLTLKAGSKVYAPNGAGVFDEITIASDVNVDVARSSTQFMVAYNKTTDTVWFVDLLHQASGTTPTGDGFYYNTSTNKMLYVRSGVPDNYEFSLPLGIVTSDSTKYTSIDQVFNGFGYIGSTVFALPGVKGLIPNGRNEDGSLKNIEFTLGNVKTFSTTSGNRTIVIQSDLELYAYLDTSYYEQINLNKNSSNEIQPVTHCGKIIVDSSNKITSFTPKTVFHAVDRNDSSWIAQQAMPSTRYIDLTLGASGSTYTAPANGWYSISKRASAVNQYVEMDCNSLGSRCYSPYGDTLMAVYVPASKGSTMKIYYNAGGATSYFRFIYAEGEN